MSLNRVGGARIERSGFWLFTSYRVFFTRTRHFTLTKREFDAARSRRDREGAATVGRDGDRALWWTAEGFFWAEEALDGEAVGLLAWDRRRRQ
ncbi:MAG: hypothetical protein EXR65_00220 [Dehalococcoidia bacterium]|nr:hypothetical protein [Dehalococcoidia bacterium]